MCSIYDSSPSYNYLININVIPGLDLKRLPLMKKRNEMLKRIPEFWLTAMRNHEVLQSLIEPEDLEILSCLDSIDVTRPENDNRVYSLTLVSCWCIVIGSYLWHLWFKLKIASVNSPHKPCESCNSLVFFFTSHLVKDKHPL